MAAEWARGRFALATGANFVFFVAVTSFFSLPVELQRLGADRAQIGRIMGVFGFASLVGIPATGALIDRLGKRPFMLAGSLLWAALAFSFSRVEALGPALYLLRILQGLAFSLAFVAVNAVVVDLAPPGQLGRAISIFGATTLVAHAVGPSLSEHIAHVLGFRRLFELVVLVSLAAAALFAVLGRGERPGETAASPALGMLALATRRGARAALVGGVCTALAFGTAIHFMPVFVRARGLDAHTPFFVSYVIAAIGVRVAAPGLGDKLGHRPVGALSALCFSGAVMSLSLVESASTLVLCALGFGLAHGITYPAMNALFVEGAPAGSRGRAMALYNLSFNVGITVAAFAAGELAERAGYSTMWLAMGASATLGAIALLVDRAR